MSTITYHEALERAEAEGEDVVGTKIFDTTDEAQNACLAHVPECVCAMILLPSAINNHGTPLYFILCPSETNGSEWEVAGTGNSEHEAWDNAFALCFA